MKASLDPRSFTIATFALMRLRNFSSIGIQIGGIGALARSSAASSPNSAFRAHACWNHGQLMSACIVGILT